MSEDKIKAIVRIFEQGFTTKEMSKGTGLAMAIAQRGVALSPVKLSKKNMAGRSRSEA